MNILFRVLAIIAIIFLAIVFYKKYQSNNSWTLLVCKNMMSNGIECNDISYEIPRFKTEKDCLLEGADKFSKEGFECGKGCKKESGLNVCSVICNKLGCN